MLTSEGHHKPAASTLTALVAVIGLVAALLSVTMDNEEPDLNQAKNALREYWRNAPSHPDVTWERLTDTYRNERAKDTDEPLTYDGYVDYFRAFDRIEVPSVGGSRQTEGWWRATVVYYWPSGRQSRTEYEFELVCPWWTRYPLLSCGSEEVRINAVANYDRKLWAKE